MKVKKYIEKIVEKGKPEDMKTLSYMLDDVICKLKEYDEECYEDYKMELYEMAYGKVLNEEMAEDIVMCMEPYHTHWTLEQTKKIQTEKGLSSIRDIDFFVVMNSAYNDYHDMFDEDIDAYVEYTKLFINDKDARDGKVFNYFMNIPKK
nr:MAG TPA: hypothetical protein [Caudoviricetes sp.]